jgi:hypothetical protein
MCHTLVTVATIATSLCVFYDVHAHMPSLPRQPFLEVCVFSVRFMLRWLDMRYNVLCGVGVQTKVTVEG